MLRITPTPPPAHSVDDVPTFLAGDDPAWNIPLIKADREKLGTNIDAHPVEVYFSGATRYSLDAQITMPDVLRGPDGPATVTIEHYMHKGKRATRFEMSSVDARGWAIASRVIEESGFIEFAKRGLVRVLDAEGPDGKPTTITPPRDEDGVTDEWMDGLSRANRGLIENLGYAVFKISKNEVASAEGKP